MKIPVCPLKEINQSWHVYSHVYNISGVPCTSRPTSMSKCSMPRPRLFDASKGVRMKVIHDCDHRTLTEFCSVRNSSATRLGLGLLREELPKPSTATGNACYINQLVEALTTVLPSQCHINLRMFLAINKLTKVRNG